MITSGLYSALILLSFFSFQAEAQQLSKLGERLSSCKNLERDDHLITYPPSLQAEAKSMFQSDRLQTAVVPEGDCFRVGTEIQLFLTEDTIPFLGKALIEKIEFLNTNDLLAHQDSGFSHSALTQLIKENPSRTYAVIHFKVTEKMQEAFVNEQYQRLPSCFPAYSDWESLRLKDENVVKDIQSGKTKAFIWNGTFNCYKIGISTEIQLARERREELGFIIPTELYTVHYSNLSDKHANILGESLEDIKKRLAEKKDVEGGYLSMVVFDYQEPRPKEEEAQEEAQEEPLDTTQDPSQDPSQNQ